MKTAQRHLPAIALGLLILVTIVGFFYYPTYPNYDSYYSLVWGHELLHGHLPSFDSYRTPTEHPLAVAFGALMSLFGQVGDRIMIFCTLGSFVALCVGMYRFGKALFTPLVGLAAAAILCTRFDFPFLAVRGYIDIPYLAFVMWAAALEVEKPRRGGVVWLLLACAGLLRPEAWLLLGLYWLWLSTGPGVSWSDRFRWAGIAAIAPFIWVALDTIVTGHPAYSLNHTSDLAESLGRAKGLSAVPSSLREFFLSLTKLPVVLAGIGGAIVISFIAPRRLAMPLVLWLVGVGTFVLVGIAGLSVIDRYLLVPALMAMLMAAVAIGGWTMLEEGSTPRRVWAGVAAVVLVFGVGFTVQRVTLENFKIELEQRKDQHQTLVQILDEQPVKDGQKCGPISTPNHKLVPEVRWITGGRVNDVIARSDPSRDKAERYGVGLYVTSRLALLREAIVSNDDDPLDSVPMDGFIRVANSTDYGAFVRCSARTAAAVP